ncbi:hypothetical protein Tco_1299647, partial [Tanacetum coccineum]
TGYPYSAATQFGGVTLLTNEATSDRVHCPLKCCFRYGSRRKATLMKKAYSSLILCSGDRDLQEVTKETSDVGIWTKLTKAVVVVGNDEITKLVMDSGDNKTCTIKGTGKVKIQLHDRSSFIPEDVRYVPGLRRSSLSLGTLEKEGYSVKMQMGEIVSGRAKLSWKVVCLPKNQGGLGLMPLHEWNKIKLDTNATVTEMYDDGKWLWFDGWLQRFLILHSTSNLSLDSNKDDKAI